MHSTCRRAAHGLAALLVSAGAAPVVLAVDRAAPQAAMAPAPATGDRGAFAGEIAAAFRKLGMEARRAECYGQILQGTLEPTSHDNAVALLRSSSNAGEVRDRVMAEGYDIIGGFRTANQACPKRPED